jgi:hypothetical protein
MITISSGPFEPEKIYPNPASTVLNIPFLAADSHYLLLDLQGKIVREGELEKSNPTIDISELNSGIYLLNIDNVRYKVAVYH